MLNYQDFLARIDEAIAQQKLAVENSERSTKAGQEEWKAQNKQLKAIDTLSQRHDARERQRENKIEQNCRMNSPPGNSAARKTRIRNTDGHAYC
jgi:flagellar FliJ protein